MPGSSLSAPLHQRDRLVEALAALGEHVAQVIERRGILGVPLQDLAQRALRTVEVLALFQHLGQHVESTRIVRAARAQAPGRRFGAGEITRLAQGRGIEIQDHRLGVRLCGAGLQQVARCGRLAGI